ncbi:hypothetical protein PQH03_06770 [Ralstonia insidiosa]|uniref:hypothetical protein n=1 Tax=Ralstonia insidiosa TaxID=190721 RepID=UPI00205F7E5B|nr:hypothetical protein [Ralstonia insidiosa]MDE4924327.1 hypothetical protein [Ralstonia insidiosa]UNJ99871.1 hypothetical protein MMB19_14205 [Ralstonia insidiosa]
MSRSGYTDDGDEDGTFGLWRGSVTRAIQGKRGQQALKDLAAAMDAMPVKTLAAESLVTDGGEFCTLGVLGNARGLDMKPIDPEDWDAVAEAFNLAPAMVREIVYENDEGLLTHEHSYVEICGPVRPWYPEYGSHSVRVSVAIPPEVLGKRRWKRMRKWVADNISAPSPKKEQTHA